MNSNSSNAKSAFASPLDPVSNPIPTSALAHWIPHRAPMIWIDEVVWADATGGECHVQVKSEGRYMDAQGLRPSSIIEFLAQAYGYVSVAHGLQQGSEQMKPASKAFLVSVTNAEFYNVTSVTDGMILRVRVGNPKQVGPITLFDGQVYAPNNSLLGKANLKVYAE